MIRLRRVLRHSLLAAALLAFVACVEKVGRSLPRLMPAQWQRLHSAIKEHAEFKPIPDWEIGFLPRPDANTDRRGFPNKDPWPEHVEIVFLGDSLLTSGVALPEKFTSLIGRLMPDEPVVNLGLDAGGVERQTLVFRRFGEPLRPRIVVTCLYLASDFDNDTRFRSWVREGHREDFFNYRMPGKNAYVSPFALFTTLQWRRLLEQSWLYVGAREQAIRWSAGADAIEDRYRFPDGTETLLARGNLEFANAQTDPADPRIDALLESLTQLRVLVTSHDATLLVALIPSFEELFRVKPGAENGNILAHTRRRLQAAGFETLDLYPALRAGGRKRASYVLDDIHLNAYGNQIVAHEFVAWFRQHRPPG